MEGCAATPPCSPGPTSVPWKQGSPRNALWCTSGQGLDSSRPRPCGAAGGSWVSTATQRLAVSQAARHRDRPDPVNRPGPGPTTGRQVHGEPQQLHFTGLGASGQSLRPGTGMEHPRAEHQRRQLQPQSALPTHPKLNPAALSTTWGDSWDRSPRRESSP